jgi:hypothetical protein
MTGPWRESTEFEPPIARITNLTACATYSKSRPVEPVWSTNQPGLDHTPCTAVAVVSWAVKRG